MMKITAEEFNRLLNQQKIRDVAYITYWELSLLAGIVEKREDKKKIKEAIDVIRSIENEAVNNINKMIGCDEEWQN
ncbi:hypothetical protein [Thomasclavelia sp.]|uniref:hypothetical protein n=1 Tax=Thomasclavelia sp. TaxID=3025757 RepID=UPI0025F5AC2F|nr:hypothetical protein [Thomasclavelia sp.]